MVDKIALNESPARTHGHDTRAEDIRLKCLELAVAGPGAGMNEATAVRRARLFEGYVTGVEVAEPGYRTEALTPPAGGWRE